MSSPICGDGYGGGLIPLFPQAILEEYVLLLCDTFLALFWGAPFLLYFIHSLQYNTVLIIHRL